MTKRNKIIVTTLLIVVAALIIFYPKIKPLFSSDSRGPSAAGEGRGPGVSQGRQLLNVSGLLIEPIKLNELKNVVDVVICSEEQKEAVAATGIFQKKVAMTDRQGGNAIYIFARKTIPLPDINSTFDEYNMLFDSEYSWNKEILSGFFAQHNKSFGQIVEESYKKPEHKERVKKYFRFLY